MTLQLAEKSCFDSRHLGKCDLRGLRRNSGGDGALPRPGVPETLAPQLWEGHDFSLFSRNFIFDPVFLLCSSYVHRQK